MITLHSHKDPGPAMNALVVKTMMIVTLKTNEMKTVDSWQHLAIWWRYYDYYVIHENRHCLRLPLELLLWLKICDPMYVINPEIHMSCLEMAEKSPFLSRLDAPDCVGKVLAHVFQYLKLRNAAESTHQKLRSPGQAPHICHRYHTSARVWKWKRTYFSSLGIFSLLFLGEKLCGPHTV